MKKYIIFCYNKRNKLVYRIEIETTEKIFESQIKNGYVRFLNKETKADTMCYLNMYNKIVIEEFKI